MVMQLLEKGLRIGKMYSILNRVKVQEP